MIKYKYFLPVKGNEPIDKYEKWRRENPDIEIVSFDIILRVKIKVGDKPVDKPVDN